MNDYQDFFSDKAVFCEKPITDNIKTTEDCYNLAASKNKILFNALHRSV
jgi:predicted dehydrogenase